MTESVIPDKEVDRVSSERQTAFNVVNVMVGTMYLSGKIQQLPPDVFDLLKEGVKTYKNYRDFIKTSYPVFPKGIIRLSNRTDYALGLVSEEYDKMLLAIWNLSTESREVEVDLLEYGFDSYKTVFYGKNKRFDFSQGKLITSFEYGHDAVLLELKKTNGE